MVYSISSPTDWSGAFRGSSIPGDLICFSHLRWSFVWQRPQHLLTRFAKQIRVFVVEEPIYQDSSEEAHLRVEENAGVTVLTPCLPYQPGKQGGFNTETNTRIRALLGPFLRDHDVASDALLWYYTPMALGAEPVGLSPSLVVFDAMDELANFRGAPAELREREAALLELADMVFAGGPSLHAARKDRHPKTYCFPSGVDAPHFRRAIDAQRPHDIEGLAGPIVGFYGVLDERIDFALVDEIAQSQPNWSIVMIGPLAKISETDLPRRPNIHFLGNRAYAELPAYLASFDVAIMPFARNESTRFISPTKTLEYLAGGKPVVSTPIADVAELYGNVVSMAHDSGSFVKAIELHLGASRQEIETRVALSQAVLARHDWDRIAHSMSRLMRQAIHEKRAATAPITNRISIGRVIRTPMVAGAELGAD